MKAIKRIVIDPDVMGGKPVIKGTRVPVQVIVEALAGGMKFEEVCKEYRVTAEDVQTALAYAAETLAEEMVHSREFDKKFDKGKDISKYLDVSKARKLKLKRVNVGLPSSNSGS